MFCVPFCVPKNIFLIVSELAENHSVDSFQYEEFKFVGYFDPSGVVSKLPNLGRVLRWHMYQFCDNFLKLRFGCKFLQSLILMKGIQKIDYFDFQKVILNRYIGHLGTLSKLGHVRKTPLGPKIPTFLDSSYQNQSNIGILATSEI